MERITVFIVDGQPLFREGIAQGLSIYQDIEIVGGCAATFDVSNLVETFSPNVVLLSVDDSFQVGIDVGRQIAKRCPGSVVIALTSNPDDAQLLQAIKIGAVAYLGKDVSAEELAGTIRRVAQGEQPISGSVLASATVVQQVLLQFQDISLKGNIMDNGMPLSSRELEIIRYISGGNSNKQIARTLNICESTVKNHIAAILQKLNAKDRTHAVVTALRQGWISVEEPV